MPDEPLQETWATRELPILRLALREVDAGGVADLEAIRQELELPGMQVYAAVSALDDAGYIEMSLAMGWSEGHASGHITRVHERARRELGTWPTAESFVDQLAAALDAASGTELELERKRLLKGAGAALGGGARDVAVSWVKSKLGVP
jgi:hypothetical protein